MTADREAAKVGEWTCSMCWHKFMAPEIATHAELDCPRCHGRGLRPAPPSSPEPHDCEAAAKLRGQNAKLHAQVRGLTAQLESHLGIKPPWTCQARVSKTDPPQDCDWPFCGCDPQAEKVLESLEESGYSIVRAVPPVKRFAWPEPPESARPKWDRTRDCLRILFDTRAVREAMESSRRWLPIEQEALEYLRLRAALEPERGADR